VRVTDDGPGVPEEQVPLLTRRFARSPEHQNVPGSGLGLAIADDIARRSGGRLTAARLREYERRWRARLWPEIRAGLAFRAMASRLSDRTIDRVIELARVDGIVPLLKQTADFNWHGAAARSLLRHPSFRRVVFSSIWS